MKPAAKDATTTGTAIAAPAEAGTSLAAPASLDSEPDAIRSLISQGVDKGLSAETLKTFQEMYERAMDREAARALSAAVAAFQQECPMIPQDIPVRNTKREGNPVMYWQTDLESIFKIINPILRRHGLAVTFDMKEDKGHLTATCIVSHIGGGERRTNFNAPVGSGTPMMSETQKVAGARTQAKRHALVDALGLVLCEKDREEPTYSDAAPVITESQAADLRALLAEVGVPEDAAVKRAGIERIEDLPASKYPGLVRALQERRK